jgi:hypothetical protein
MSCQANPNGESLSSHYNELARSFGTGVSYELASNPYVAMTDATMGRSLTTRDAVVRAKSVQVLRVHSSRAIRHEHFEHGTCFHRLCFNSCLG